MSGIYIKGVEPPVCCGKCSEKIDPDNRRCLADGHIFEETLGKLTNRRDANCPIFSVRPHGRLIDADAFANQMRELESKAETDGFDLGAAWYSTFIRHIELAPTIIPAEEDAP